jgi:hypothetical protein
MINKSAIVKLDTKNLSFLLTKKARGYLAFRPTFAQSAISAKSE